MEGLINLMANIAAKTDGVDACVLAVVMKPTEENPQPQVEVLTIGENAVHLLGVSAFISHEIFKQLEG